MAGQHAGLILQPGMSVAVPIPAPAPAPAVNLHAMLLSANTSTSRAGREMTPWASSVPLRCVKPRPRRGQPESGNLPMQALVASRHLSMSSPAKSYSETLF